jgi:hypothetical protein
VRRGSTIHALEGGRLHSSSSHSTGHEQRNSKIYGNESNRSRSSSANSTGSNSRERGSSYVHATEGGRPYSSSLESVGSIRRGSVFPGNRSHVSSIHSDHRPHSVGSDGGRSTTPNKMSVYMASSLNQVKFMHTCYYMNSIDIHNLLQNPEKEKFNTLRKQTMQKMQKIVSKQIAHQNVDDVLSHTVGCIMCSHQIRDFDLCKENVQIMTTLTKEKATIDKNMKMLENHWKSLKSGDHPGVQGHGAEDGDRHGLVDYGRKMARISTKRFTPDTLNLFNSLVGGWAGQQAESPLLKLLLDQDTLITKSLKYNNDREKLFLWIAQLKQAAADLSKSKETGPVGVNFNLDLSKPADKVKHCCFLYDIHLYDYNLYNVNQDMEDPDQDKDINEAGFDANEILQNEDAVFSLAG